MTTTTTTERPKARGKGKAAATGPAFRAEAKLFAGALGLAAAAAAKMPTIPILGDALVEAGDGIVRVTATDLEQWVTSEFPADVSAHGSVCIPAGLAATTLKRLAAGEDVDVSVDGSDLRIAQGHFSGALRTVDAGDFPQPFVSLGDAERVTMAGADLVRALGVVEQSISRDKDRFYLTGVFLSLGPDHGKGPTLRAVATNGHTMSIIDVDAFVVGSLPGVILPSRAARALVRILAGVEQVTLDIGPKGLVAGMAHTRLATRVIDGEFPDYSRVIPATGLPSIVDRAALSAAVSRVAARASRGTQMRVEFLSDLIVLTVTREDRGTYRDVVEADFEGKPVTVALDPGYVSGILAALASATDVAITPGDPGSALRFEVVNDARQLHIIMPMRI